jgi:cyclophilin family peptidyl-prolyl cis-trans isomerase
MDKLWQMKQSILSSTLFLCVMIFFACGNGNEHQTDEAEILNFSDAVVQEIYKLQTARDVQGLTPFLKAEEPVNRYLAAMAFASVQDTSLTTIQALGEMLRNPKEDESIRAIAAYALGQMKSNKATQALLDAFQPEVKIASYLVNAQILEAIGRSADKKYLKYLSAAPNYLPTDTLMLEGQASGIYRYALRGISSNLGNNRMLELLESPKYPEKIRRIASNYFARLPQIIFDNPEKINQLVAYTKDEKDAFTRMALAKALGNLEMNEGVLIGLQDMFRAEGESLVKINILNSLKQYEYVDVKPIFLGAIRDANTQVSTLASGYFISNGIRNDVELYYGIAQDSTIENQFLSINMMGASLAHISYTEAKKRKEINEVLQLQFNDSKDPYERGAILKTLSVFALNYQFIYDAMFAAKHPFVKTSGVTALANIRRHKKLSLIMGSDYEWILGFFKRAFKEVYTTGDVGMMAATSEILRDEDLGYQYYFKNDNAFLSEALTKLKLPRDIETYHEIQKTIKYFTNNDTLKLIEPQNDYQIDWQPLLELTKDTRVKIETSKGDIFMQLYPVEAPGTVSYFLELIKKGFYDNKAFHRVVPNFVAQGGCPRGDGYGSSNELIRSEFSPLKYDDAGWVGVASAGKDTESCQFFITHSPTPHLDGRYTIFAKVTEGLDIVQTIQVGDKIKKISIQ